MNRNKAYRYRIYPNEVQSTLLQKSFGCTRFIWNAMLADKKEYYEKEKKLLRVTPASYKKNHEWLKEVDSLALANVQLQLEQAFRNFFRDTKVGYPKFKSKKKSMKSYTTNSVNGNIRISGRMIRLPKVGEIRIRLHRTAPETYVLKSVTVSQEPSGKYYASVLYEYENQVEEKNDSTKAIGLDFAMHGLYEDSNGNACEMPSFYRASERRLSRAQRKLSRMYVKGKTEQSHRYYKQKHKVAVLHEKVRNQRNDFLQKKAKVLSDAYDYICIEDLDMKGMSQALKFGKTVADNSWGRFTSLLQYKMEEKGKHLIKVDRFYPSSQTCHCCGALNPEIKDMKIRRWACPECGAEHDRDHNAAINIKTEGLRIALL